VYFPEEDVKMAYGQMEEEFMRQAAETPAATPAAAPGPQSAAFSLLASPALADQPDANRTYSFAEIMAVMRGMGMEDVRQAYAARGQRLAVIEGLLGAGALGIAADGMVALVPDAKRPADALTAARELLLTSDATVTTDSATPAFVLAWLQNLLTAENANRTLIISGMGRAMVKLMTENNPQALEQDPNVQAAMTLVPRKMYAEYEQEHAQDAWWVQLPDSSWAVKNPAPAPAPAAQ
ncbi:MAG TPA: hypothetical protein PKM88_05165, partial [bacterium]|nr:hypothetical protein [bacterium]